MILDEKQQKELIPKLQVLDDMYADKGVVSMAARDYYYEYYANESERIGNEPKCDIKHTVKKI